MSKCLVTGGAGFIGSHVVENLIRCGHDVAVVDDLSTGERSQVDPEASFYELDICHRAELETVFAREKPAYVFHLAASLDWRRGTADPSREAMTNIIGTINLLSAAVRHGVGRFIFASSCAVYGRTETLPVEESAILTPCSPYGISKYCAELYVGHICSAQGIPSVALRYANVYGPRQRPVPGGAVSASFIRALLADKEPTVYGTGDVTRDFIYVEDVAEATVRALESEVVGPLNISTGIETSIGHILHLLAIHFENAKKPLHVAARRGEVSRFCAANGRAAEALSWEPKTSLAGGLAATLKWHWRRNPASCPEERG